MIKETRIFGLTIQWSSPGKQRRKKVTSKLERLAEAALLDVVLRNDQTLADIINMFGRIQVHREDKTEPQFNGIRDKIFGKAVETILNSRRQELERRVDGITDRVIGAADRSRGQREEALFLGVIDDDPRGVPGAIHHHPRRARRPGQTSGAQALLRDLELLAGLVKLAGNAIKDKGGCTAGKMYAVEYDGEFIEMDENEYLSHVRRRQEQRTEEFWGHGLDAGE